jgi:hypothetical protein
MIVDVVHALFHVSAATISGARRDAEEYQVVSRESKQLLRPVNVLVVMLCAVFIGWSMMGLPAFNERWITYGKWWGLLVYILVHLGLAGMILRTTGLQLWSCTLCALGLVIGEWVVLQYFLAFTAWQFGGFV